MKARSSAEAKILDRWGYLRGKGGGHRLDSPQRLHGIDRSASQGGEKKKIRLNDLHDKKKGGGKKESTERPRSGTWGA